LHDWCHDWCHNQRQGAAPAVDVWCQSVYLSNKSRKRDPLTPQQHPTFYGDQRRRHTMQLLHHQMASRAGMPQTHHHHNTLHYIPGWPPVQGCHVVTTSTTHCIASSDGPPCRDATPRPVSQAQELDPVQPLASGTRTVCSLCLGLLPCSRRLLFAEWLFPMAWLQLWHRGKDLPSRCCCCCCCCCCCRGTSGGVPLSAAH